MLFRTLLPALAFVLVLTGCGVGTTDEAAVADDAATSTETDIAETDIAVAGDLDPIAVPMSLYIMTEGGDPTSPLSSTRTVDEVTEIADRVSDLWAPAGIVFDPVRVIEIEAPTDVLGPIALGLDTGPFLDQAGRTFDVPDTGAVNGFFVSQAAGVNGFAPLNSRIFFVVDQPSVHDERVTSHEIGHLFGLHHVLDDPERLLFSGTNGIDLTEVEIDVARYTAQGILDGAR